jgi:hypothetical protein
MNWLVVVSSVYGSRQSGAHGYLISSIRCHNEATADAIREFLTKQSVTGRINCMLVWDGEDREEPEE